MRPNQNSLLTKSGLWPKLEKYCSENNFQLQCVLCASSSTVSSHLPQGDVSRGALSVSAERGGGGGGGSAPLRQCNISLPDGSCCSVPLRAGVSIRDLLMGLCEKLCINLAAIDLFLVGGEKVQRCHQFTLSQVSFHCLLIESKDILKHVCHGNKKVLCDKQRFFPK